MKREDHTIRYDSATFDTGSKVVLLSGGPEMTVTNIHEGVASVTWIQEDKFPIDCLDRIGGPQ